MVDVRVRSKNLLGLVFLLEQTTLYDKVLRSGANNEDAPATPLDMVPS